MANIEYIDGGGTTRYRKNSTAGTDGDPDIPEFVDTNSAAILAKLSADPATETTLAAVKTAVEILDDAISGNEMQVDVVNTPTVQEDTRTLAHYTGTAASSGDNEVIAAQGAGVQIVVSQIMVQNESSTETTMILKDGATAIWRCLGQNQGDGLSLLFHPGREWRLTANTALNLNLSGANSCGISVAYWTE